MNHSQFVLWKLHAVVAQLGMPCLKLFIPIFIRPLLYKIYGACIGKNTAIGGKLLDPFLTTLEEYAVIGEDAIVSAHIMVHNKFCLAPVLIKKKATIGIKSIIMPGVVIGENSIILPGSLVQKGTTIAPNEVWGGNPAKYIKGNEEEFDG